MNYDKDKATQLTNSLIYLNEDICETLKILADLQQQYGDKASELIVELGSKDNTPAMFVHSGYLVSIDWQSAEDEIGWDQGVDLTKVEEL